MQAGEIGMGYGRLIHPSLLSTLPHGDAVTSLLRTGEGVSEGDLRPGEPRQQTRTCRHDAAWERSVAPWL